MAGNARQRGLPDGCGEDHGPAASGGENQDDRSGPRRDSDGAGGVLRATTASQKEPPHTNTTRGADGGPTRTGTDSDVGWDLAGMSGPDYRSGARHRCGRKRPLKSGGEKTHNL